MPSHPIDIVICWVDGTDEAWLRERHERKASELDFSENLNHAARYRDTGLLKYTLRSIEAYAPWVRHIYIVSPGHKPQWINDSHEKLIFIDQSDIVPEKYQPTFKSTGVEWHLHNIQGLSENFIYMNDDMFFNHPVFPEDFFVKGLPKLTAIYRPLPIRDFSHMVLSTLNVLNRFFIQGEVTAQQKAKFFNPLYGKAYLGNLFVRNLDRLSSRNSFKSSYLFPHVALPIRQQTMRDIWELDIEELHSTCLRSFRSHSDVIIWLTMFWEIEQGSFTPQKPSTTSMISIDENSKLQALLRNESVKQICVNDSEDIENFSEDMFKGVVTLLESKFNRKSNFEK